jgi:putative ABC transport system ATP-binding protein
MRSDSTTLTIAHRLATIRRADWIIVLSSEGDVAEQGTYAELVRKKDGAFNRLMKMQMEGVVRPEDRGGVIYEEAEKEEKLEAQMKEEEERRAEEEREAQEKEREERDKESERREKEKAAAET